MRLFCIFVKFFFLSNECAGCLNVVAAACVCASVHLLNHIYGRRPPLCPLAASAVGFISSSVCALISLPRLHVRFCFDATTTTTTATAEAAGCFQCTCYAEKPSL